MNIKFRLYIVLSLALFYSRWTVAEEDVAASLVETVLIDPLAISNLWQLGMGLLLVLVLIIGLAWMMRRVGYMQSATGDQFKVVSSLSVGSREKLVLVQAGEVQLLIGVAPGQVRKIHVLDKKIPIKVVDSSFAKKLQQVISKEKNL